MFMLFITVTKYAVTSRKLTRNINMNIYQCDRLSVNETTVLLLRNHVDLFKIFYLTHITTFCIFKIANNSLFISYVRIGFLCIINERKD
jgi:hypothetical protein